MKKHLFSAVAGVAALACALPAAAQSIDYGSLEQLFGEPVTTSATGSPQRSTEAPADMQIISADDIRRAGTTDLPQILSRLAGIDVLAFSAGHSDVSVRGYDQANSPRLLVLINGRQVYLDHYGTTVWRSLPVQLDEIRQIEVVKGPNSALFGFNAVSGVVNIITYNPKFDAKSAVTVRAGDHDHFAGSAVASFKLGQRLSVRLSGGAERQDEWDPADTGVPSSSLQDPQTLSAALDAVLQLTPKSELRVESSWSNLRESLVAAGGYSPSELGTYGLKGTFTAETPAGLVQLSAYQNRLDSKYRLSPDFNWDNHITVASAQDLFKLGAAHTFRVAAEYRHNELNTASITGGLVSYNVLSGSGMWNWAVTDKLSTTAAVRVDRLAMTRSGDFPAGFPLADNALWDRSTTETSVNAAAVWRPTADDTVRLSYGRGVQVPSLIELGGIQLASHPFPGFTIALMGNPALEASVVSNYELTYDRTLRPLNAKFGVRVFWQKWQNLKSALGAGDLVIPPTMTTYPGLAVINASDSKMKGVELTLAGKLAHGVHWSADYTYTDVEDQPFDGVDPALWGVAFGQTTPKSRGNLALGWADKHWEVDGNLHYVSEQQAYGATGGLVTVPGYASLSARAAYRLDNGVTFAVSGQNLLHERQDQTGGLPAERRFLFSLSKSW